MKRYRAKQSGIFGKNDGISTGPAYTRILLCSIVLLRIDCSFLLKLFVGWLANSQSKKSVYSTLQNFCETSRSNATTIPFSVSSYLYPRLQVEQHLRASCPRFLPRPTLGPAPFRLQQTGVVPLRLSFSSEYLRNLSHFVDPTISLGWHTNQTFCYKLSGFGAILIEVLLQLLKHPNSVCGCERTDSNRYHAFRGGCKSHLPPAPNHEREMGGQRNEFEL